MQSLARLVKITRSFGVAPIYVVPVDGEGIYVLKSDTMHASVRAVHGVHVCTQPLTGVGQATNATDFHAVGESRLLVTTIISQILIQSSHLQSSC